MEIGRLMQDFNTMADVSKLVENPQNDYYGRVREFADKLLHSYKHDYSFNEKPDILYNDSIAKAVADGYGDELKNELSMNLSSMRNKGAYSQEDIEKRESAMKRIFVKINKYDNKRREILIKYEGKRNTIVNKYKSSDKNNKNKHENEYKKRVDDRDSWIKDEKTYAIIGIVIMLLIALAVCILIGSKVIENIKKVFDLIMNGQFNAELLKSLLKAVLGVAAIAAPICIALWIWDSYKHREASAHFDNKGEKEMMDNAIHSDSNDIIHTMKRELLNLGEDFITEIKAA